MVTDEDPRIAEARRIVRDFNRIGYAMRNSVATRTTALFAPVLCLPGILIAIPYTAHTVLQSETDVALLGGGRADNPRSIGAQAFRDRGADAAGGAGHQCDVIL